MNAQIKSPLLSSKLPRALKTQTSLVFSVTEIPWAAVSDQTTFLPL